MIIIIVYVYIYIHMCVRYNVHSSYAKTLKSCTSAAQCKRLTCRMSSTPSAARTPRPPRAASSAASAAAPPGGGAADDGRGWGWAATPGDVRGISMGISWGFHGDFMGITWGFHGDNMGISGDWNELKHQKWWLDDVGGLFGSWGCSVNFERPDVTWCGQGGGRGDVQVIIKGNRLSDILRHFLKEN